MVATTPEICVCRAHPQAVLSAAWVARVRPVLAKGVDEGRPIDVQKLQLSAKLLTGISSGLPDAFDARYSNLSHHLLECPLACPADLTALALLA